MTSLAVGQALHGRWSLSSEFGAVPSTEGFYNLDIAVLFDDLVGTGEQRRRYAQT